MKLVSLNIAEPTEIEYNGRTMKTGIFKKPVDHPVMVNQFNLSGDGQADLKNHGGEAKSVYGFSANHYDYWRQQSDSADLMYGQFGENLTISNLDEKSLCIGDQLKIGDCILEVSQPRVPCVKLGIALDDKTMPKRFVQHGYTGIYFRVKQTGQITTGDDVELHYKHPAQLAVHTLFNAYFDSKYPDAKTVMLKAELINELADEWQQKVLSRLKR